MNLSLGSFDLLVTLCAFFGFFFFLLAHIVGLRYLQPEGFSRTVLVSFVAGGLVVVLFFNWDPTGRMIPSSDYPRGVGVLGGIASVFIYFLLVYCYMGLVFGMGEAAIRIRLLREFERRPTKSARLEEIYQSYNKQVILESRLRRLVREGVLTFESNTYRIRNRILLIRVHLLRWFKSLTGFSDS